MNQGESIMTINVCIAGATGWVGADLSRAVHAAEDLQLSGAIARRCAGRPLGAVLDIPGLDLEVCATAREALARPCDVFCGVQQAGSSQSACAAGPGGRRPCGGGHLRSDRRRLCGDR